MVEDNKKDTSIAVINSTTALSDQTSELLAKVVSETDPAKTKDLAMLFNENQKKKSMVRAAKLNDLLDAVTDQALARFTSRPDEISNKELLDALKTVQDSIDKHQKQINGLNDAQEETPLIQINQQTNEVNVNAESDNLTRSSKNKVKDAVLAILAGINAEPTTNNTANDIIDVAIESEDTVETDLQKE